LIFNLFVDLKVFVDLNGSASGQPQLGIVTIYFSAVFGQHPESPETINVRMGSFDGDPGIRPMGRLHVASAAVWEPIPDDGLPRLPGPLEA
jgi:hypothetical protein